MNSSYKLNFFLKSTESKIEGQTIQFPNNFI